jgi:hypothetical protein
MAAYFADTQEVSLVEVYWDKMMKSWYFSSIDNNNRIVDDGPISNPNEARMASGCGENAIVIIHPGENDV